jgi:hypothetical protein
VRRPCVELRAAVFSRFLSRGRFPYAWRTFVDLNPKFASTFYDKLAVIYLEVVMPMKFRIH